MLVMGIGRATLYKQFDRALLVAIGFYGVFAYATRYWTPLLMAELDVYLSWRWMYWVFIPVALLALVLVWRYFRPDRPAKPMHLPIDWLAVTLFVAWVVAIVFAFSWYRKWGGWTSNAFAATAILCVLLPVVLVVWLGSGFSPDEHLKRLVRTRVYVLAMTTRGLMLLHLVAVLTIVGMYATELRDYPRTTAGWLMVADRADDGHHHVADDLVPPAEPAARLAGRGDGGGGGLCVVAVVAGQLHPEGARGRHPGLLGGVRRPDPARLPDRRGRGAEPQGLRSTPAPWPSSASSCRSSRCRPRRGR